MGPIRQDSSIYFVLIGHSYDELGQFTATQLRWNKVSSDRIRSIRWEVKAVPIEQRVTHGARPQSEVCSSLSHPHPRQQTEFFFECSWTGELHPWWNINDYMLFYVNNCIIFKHDITDNFFRLPPVPPPCPSPVSDWPWGGCENQSCIRKKMKGKGWRSSHFVSSQPCMLAEWTIHFANFTLFF